jgi:hypothetical protein
MYPEVSSKVFHDSFCQLGNSVSLPWVIYCEAFYLRVVSSSSRIPVICPELVLFLIHMEQITHKLGAACYAMRSVTPPMLQETLMMVYCAYFRSIMNYGLTFWGNPSHSVKMFKIQKNIIRIITGCRCTDSSSDLFKNARTVPFQSQYMYYHFSYLWFTTNIHSN